MSACRHVAVHSAKILATRWARSNWKWCSDLISIPSNSSDFPSNAWLVDWFTLIISTTAHHIASILEPSIHLSDPHTWLAYYHAPGILCSMRQNSTLSIGHCLTLCLFSMASVCIKWQYIRLLRGRHPNRRDDPHWTCYKRPQTETEEAPCQPQHWTTQLRTLCQGIMESTSSWGGNCTKSQLLQEQNRQAVVVAQCPKVSTL